MSKMLPVMGHGAADTPAVHPSSSGIRAANTSLAESFSINRTDKAQDWLWNSHIRLFIGRLVKERNQVAFASVVLNFRNSEVIAFAGS